MSPHRVQAALESWRAAERHRDSLEPDTARWVVADAAVVEAHRAYLAMVKQVEAEAAVAAPEPPRKLEDSVV